MLQTHFFDGHNDVLTRLLDLPADSAVEAFIQGDGKGHIDLPRMLAGNLAGGMLLCMCHRYQTMG